MKILVLHRLVYCFALCMLLFPLEIVGQVTVVTFHDQNNNGIQDDSEGLISGLIVTGTDALGNEFPLLDDGNGTFFLPSELIVSRLRIRVSGYDETNQVGVAGTTNIFFLENGETAFVPVSTGPNYNVGKSRILLPCYDGGPSDGKKGPAFVSFPYMVDGVAKSKGGDAPDPSMDATIEEIGSTWGVAVQNTKVRAFASTLVKRHVGIGPMREGGLYLLDYTNPDSVDVVGMDLQGIVPSVGPTLDFGKVKREIVDGDIDETMPYALTHEDGVATYDVDAFAKIGNAGFGDIDLEEDEKTLWMVNLYQRSLVAMDVSDSNLVPGTSNIKNYPIMEMTGLPNLNYRYAMCINAGGNVNGTGSEPFTDHNKVAWDKNKYSVDGKFAYTPYDVGNLLNPEDKTSERPLYTTYRTGNFSYEIPVPAAETYTVTLHFAEPNSTYKAGDRLFDIKAEGQFMQSGFDIVAKANGARKATTITFQVDAMDGVLNLDFVSLQGAKIKQAIVSGIEVVGQSIMESGTLRPWGLNFHQGKGYLGVVADGSVSHSRDHLFGFVLQFDPNNMEGGFTEVMAFPFGYPRERASNAHLPQPQPLRSAEWQAWVNEWDETQINTATEQLSSSGALLCGYPQPIISDINFTEDGGLVIGLMDRWAHQTGYRNYNTNLGDQTLIVAYAAGDILKAFNVDGVLRLETENFDDGTYFRKDDGPSFAGEFFYEDFFVAPAAHHGEIFTGGLGILPGTKQVVNTVFNPIVTQGNSNFEHSGVYTQGIQFYNTENGKKERAYLFVDQYIAGKANGLGDMEFVSDVEGGEIGNYVWCDGNGNGIQDPQEFGIDGVMLTLHDKENAEALVDMQTTANGGNYTFKDLLPNHCYSIRVDLSKLEALGFSGNASPTLMGGDVELDSDGDMEMIPGYAVAMFCTGEIGENNHTIDFGFLGPLSNDCELVACPEMGSGCAEFDFASIESCVLPDGSMNDVTVYATFENDSLKDEITSFPYEVCTSDTVYARVSIPGDTMCYSIGTVTLQALSTMPEFLFFAETACLTETVDLIAILEANSFPTEDLLFYTDRQMPLDTPYQGSTSAFPVSMDLQHVSVASTLTTSGGCMAFALIEVRSLPSAMVEAGSDTSTCGFVCVDLTTVGATFSANGSGASDVQWSTSGDGTFEDSPRFGEARLYCPGSMDVENGTVTLRLSVLDDACFMVSDSIVISVADTAAQFIPSANDTIDCIHPFVSDPELNDTFATCKMIFACVDTVEGTVISYDFIPGDCEDIIKYIKRTQRLVYKKQVVTCMDTIAIRALPEEIVCPQERDSVYCHTGYEKDENGHPSPSVTGFPMADTIPLWPQAPSVCDILVKYYDTEFNGECPSVIRRDWYIKNGCAGTFDTCSQWIMIFDTLGPTITKYDTAAFYVPINTTTHDCFAEVYAPPIMVEDTCSGVKQVKATFENYGVVSMTLNPATGYYESHEKVRIPVTVLADIENTIATIYYEALDSCHNVTYGDTLPIFIVDRVKPVAVCDKGLNVTVSDTIEWVHASAFDEGSWDNCDVALLLARRSDWATACGVDLCDDTHLLYAGEHHDSAWCARLETDKHINPVEAHYQKSIDWLCEDGQSCNFPILLGWFYDLVKYPTVDCIDHPYDVDASYLDGILRGESDDLGNLLISSVLPCLKPLLEDTSTYEDIYELLATDPSLMELAYRLYFDAQTIAFRDQSSFGSLYDMGKQIGGGWSDAVPFCCEDACQDVKVEVLVMDYWCNWSKCWTTVRVEDKTPPEVVCELYDATISCSSYKTYYQGAVELALEGDFDSLQNVLGRYDQVHKDAYGQVDAKTEYKIYTLTCDSVLVEKDTLVHDEHQGYIWKSYSYYKAEYDTLTVNRFNGQIADNCGLVSIEEKPWVNLDACGNGYIKRVFKFVGQCSDEANGHFADTITRYQTIWVTNDCDISKSMFESPKDTVIYSCGVEYDLDGSGNVGGLLSPEYTGEGKYVFDNDCRLVGIGYYDKVFKIVGGDEACYKVIRTWCYADWCALGEPIEKSWWLETKYQGKFLTSTQKIIVYDSVPPQCTIDSIPEVIAAAGCYYNLNTSILVQDECGVLDYSWRLLNTKTDEVVAQGAGDLEGDSSRFAVTAENLGSGTYKLKAIVTDECQNESICEAEFVVTANKKPTPVCVTSLTVDLTPMDLSGDGVIDTAMAVVDAKLFNSSSQAACGSQNSKLVFRIDDGTGEPALPAKSFTKLELGCEDQGVNEVRLYVLDESGTWDYCTVLLNVQTNALGCDVVNQASGVVVGEILTEEGVKVDQVDVKVEGNSGVALWQAEDVNGDYHVNVTMGVEAYVRPKKNTDPLNGVSTSDLILIQKALLGKSTLSSEFKEKAADANNDGKVSPVDLIDIRRLILGNIDNFTSSDSWRFYDRESSKSFYHIDQMKERMEANFVGVKIGDVNGTTDPARRAGRSSEALVMKVSDDEAGNVRFSSTAEKDIAGLQFTLEFDSDKMMITRVLGSDKIGLESGNLNLTKLDEGWMTVSWNPADGQNIHLAEGDELFTLVVEQKETVSIDQVMTISSRITQAEAYEASGLESDIAIEFENSLIVSAFELLQNRPNPWKHNTVIGFSVPTGANSILSIFDVNGREVKRLEGFTAKGYHEWAIDVEDIPSAGVYYYKLETEGNIAVRKMILMN